MSATSAKFRPHVFKGPDRVYGVRVPRGRWAEKQAIKHLRVALEARDLIDPGEVLEVSLLETTKSFQEFRLATVLAGAPRALRALRIGDHVRVLETGAQYHMMLPGHVIQVTGVNLHPGSGGRERVYVYGQSRAGDHSQNWMYVDDLEYTTDPLSGRPWL